MKNKKVDVVVMGAGPGGYAAAFRAADLGQKVTLVNRYDILGGVCLNVGCIPSKTLLHVAEWMNEIDIMKAHGIDVGKPKINLEHLRAHKDGVVKKLTEGLAGLAKMRKVDVVIGEAEFKSANQLMVKQGKEVLQLEFKKCVIAAGSQVLNIPGFPMEHENVIDSTGALQLKKIPKHMLIVGGGIIGLEMATVYHALGSKITIVELGDQLIPAADLDLIKAFQKTINGRYESILLNTKVTQVKPVGNDLEVYFEGESAPKKQKFDQVLLAVGRSPNTKKINAQAAGIKVNERGFIEVNEKQQTNVPHIYAIGDIVGQPMLAHKATHEGKVAAEVLSGIDSTFNPLTIPSVAYTDPELAWVGLTEKAAKAKKIPYETGVFPWAASGRALSMQQDSGITKLLFHEKTKRIIGAGVVGRNAGEVIAEANLAIEMGSTIEDLCLTVHAHPTLAESIGMAAEVAHGSITDLPPARKK